mmetsp:Transcript_5468/g.11169  ORF Transcript_5468/g.11169 Transcript_5468/m.11169 type:complete len:321 (-) Transcript_5468:29-991(-)|eukprot:CAMPEP_0182528120 /NCGR_PEP_ID=MMETSP1323-20130603/4309_1 /TAXON_ID=236787 /ORGANISM="Florenciella parvula, Strain RCC1693" /LENGTH=320 /DNA_ID=CAMNT_0024737201 /DNA_START=237 /DNA_END=1199 /DNA_ORIENTATION=-
MAAEDDGADAAADGADAAVAFGNAKVTADEPTDEQGDERRFEELNKQLYDPVPTDNCLYGKSNFWDGRYMKNEEVFEWYHDYAALHKIISRYIDPEMSILHAGCGNSELCEHMVDDGYEKITNIDFSRVVIDQMKEKYGEGENCSLGEDVIFHQMDFTDMQGEYEDKIYEAVIDKAAMDALYCAELGAKKVKKALDEFDRVLTNNGVYISISYGRPENRLTEFDNDDPEDSGFLSWNVAVHTIPKPTVNPYTVVDMKNLDELYFVYVCTKDQKLAREKDDKREKERMIKLGLYKKKKKGMRPARVNKRSEARKAQDGGML